LTKPVESKPINPSRWLLRVEIIYISLYMKGVVVVGREVWFLQA